MSGPAQRFGDERFFRRAQGGQPLAESEGGICWFLLARSRGRPLFHLLLPGGIEGAAESLEREHAALVAADGVEDHALQFADIAGKVMVGEQGIELPRRGDPAFAEPGRSLKEKMVDQQGDILAALPQRRQSDMMRFEAVIEVLAKSLVFLQIIHIAERGHYNPGIGRFGHISSEGIILAFLEQAQQFDLGFDAEVADLVEEERAASRLLDQSLAVALGAGERPLAMTEEGIGKEMIVDAGHVDGDKLAGAAAQIVQGAGDQLLAGASLAGDEHGQRRGGDGLDVLKDAAHGRAVGDDGGEFFRMFKPRREQVLLQLDILLAHLTQLQRAHYHRDQPGIIHRFDHIIKSTRLDGADHPFDFIDGGDDDDRDVGIVANDKSQQFLTRELGHHHVKDDDGAGRLRQDLQGHAALLASSDIGDPFGDEGITGAAQELLFVVDEQHRPFRIGGECHRFLTCLVLALTGVLLPSLVKGSRTRTVVPWPGVEANSMSPPCCLTIL